MDRVPTGAQDCLERQDPFALSATLLFSRLREVDYRQSHATQKVVKPQSFSKVAQKNRPEYSGRSCKDLLEA